MAKGSDSLNRKLSIFFFVMAFIVVLSSGCTKKSDYTGTTLRVASSIDLTGGSYQEGALKFARETGCTVEFTDDFENCDLFYSSGEDFSSCQPITKYVNPKNKLYTRQIIEQNCSKDGEIYGVSHILMGNLNYCTYSPDQYGDKPLPYEYYKNSVWDWDHFIEMCNALESNIAVDWSKSYINMQNSLLYNEETATGDFDYGTQEQIEWLNFVRTLIYDEGIVNNTEGAFKVDFLPALVLNSVESITPPRYIPWPTKTGDIGEMFVDEYHFCVPANAQNPKASVELANYMIESCINTRTALYESSMTKEDYKIFRKQLKNFYTFPPHTDYVPGEIFIQDFVRGKTVTEHIYNVENDILHIE